MTTVYFIKFILVVCVAFISNKNLQKSHIYKMSRCIQCIYVALDLLLKQNVLFCHLSLFFFCTSDLNRTMQLTFSSNVFSFLKYTTYITLIFEKTLVGCTRYLQPLCWHQISKDTLHSQNAKREECSLTRTLCIHLFTDKSILTPSSLLCLSQPTL